jgi:asparaginyl-tRNA synthetase
MSKTEIIEGFVTHNRNLGGLVFIEVQQANAHRKALAKKDSMESSLFKALQALKIGDFCRMEVDSEEKDRVIRNLISHIKKVKEFSWPPSQDEIVKAYSYLLHILRNYFTMGGYTEVRVPLIHPGRKEGDIFAIDFFGEPGRLSSSNSLYLDVFAVRLQRVYSIQRCFRAEQSHTNRHLSEFDILEVSLLDFKLEDAMREIQNIVTSIVEKFKNGPYGHLCRIDLPGNKKTFSICEYEEIEEKYHLDKKGLGYIEREIAQSSPLFIINYPRKIASWTATPIDKDYSRNFNLLLPKVGEVAEGTEKQTDMNKFRLKIKAVGVESQLRWYQDMIPYTNFYLSSFGIGIERLCMWLMGLRNIREIHPIYRDTRFSEIKPDEEKNEK